MTSLIELLGKDADSLLNDRCQGIPKETLHLRAPDVVERIFFACDRNPRVLVNLRGLITGGRLAHTGYMSIQVANCYMRRCDQLGRRFERSLAISPRLCAPR